MSAMALSGFWVQPDYWRIHRGRYVPGRREVRQRVHGTEGIRNSLGREETCIAATHDYDVVISGRGFQTRMGGADAA